MKYIKKYLNKVDISPFARGIIIRVFLYFLVGSSLVIFTSISTVAKGCFYKDQSGQTICRSVEKFTFNDFTLEKFELINPGRFIIFSSYAEIVIKSNEPQTLQVRGPPLNRS